MSDEFEKLRQVTQHRKGEEAGATQRYQSASRDRLWRILKKKVTTSFIGAIARVETLIGKDLWGHGKPLSECTPNQKEWREIWEQCRNEILNNGNNQLRAIENEVGEYVVSWNRHSIRIPVKDKGNV